MKKNEQLFTLIEHVDDSILEKAFSVKSSRTAAKSWMPLGNIAAVFVGIIAVASLAVIVFMLGTNQYSPITDPFADLNGIQGHTQENGELPPIMYDSSLLGLRIEFPGNWEGNFTVEPVDWPPDSTLENRGGLERIVVRTTWGGMLIWISRHPANTWDMDSLPPVRHEIILETNDYIFFITWPSDVQWRTSYEEAVFRQMSDEIHYIEVSFIGHHAPTDDAEYPEESPLVDAGIPLETDALVGFIEIHGNTLYITPVEVFLIYGGSDLDFFTDTFWRSVVFIEQNDIQKMDEFGLDAENDFPSGNHIRPNWHCAERADIDILSFEITEETEFFVRGMRSALEDILPYLYPSVVHFIEVYDGMVVRLVQEFKFTI